MEEIDIAELLWEGCSIQSILTKSVRRDAIKNLACSFSRLMFQGKVNAAILLLAPLGRGAILHIEDSIDLGDVCHQGAKSVSDILCSKHPNANPARLEALIIGNADTLPVHPVVYNQITVSSIRSVKLHFKGAAGPSGPDVHCRRRLCTLLAKR